MDLFANRVTLCKNTLILGGGRRPPIDLAAAIAGKHFKGLHIYHKPSNLQVLGSLESVVELRLQSVPLKDLTLICGLHRLKDLSLISGSLRVCDVAFAKKTLTRLWLNYHRSLTDVSPVATCKKLKVLCFHNLPRLQRCCDLSVLRHLEFLGLRNIRSWPSITGLVNARGLKKLLLDRTKIRDGVWEPLLKLKSLEYVCGLEDAFGKKAAANFRKLRPNIETPRRFPV